MGFRLWYRFFVSKSSGHLGFLQEELGKRKRKQKFGYFEAIDGFSPLEIDAHKTSKWVLSSSPKRVRGEHSKT